LTFIQNLKYFFFAFSFIFYFFLFFYFFWDTWKRPKIINYFIFIFLGKYEYFLNKK